MRYFDDLKDGEHLHCQPVVMTREAIIDFGTNFDPQPFHTDERARVCLFLVDWSHLPFIRSQPAPGLLLKRKVMSQS
jgi:hypothetical protein